MRLKRDNTAVVEASVDIFGIFDGHGGKQAATYASRHMADLLLATLAEENMAEFAKECEARDQLLACSHVTEEMSNLWEAQDQLVDVLPGSLTKVFGKLQTDFFQHTKVCILLKVPLPLSWKVEFDHRFDRSFGNSL